MRIEFLIKPQLLAVLTWVVPFTLGWVVGIVLRWKLRGASLGLAMLVVALALVSPPFLIAPITWISAYDHLWMGSMALFGLLVAPRPGAPRRVTLGTALPTVITLVIALVIVEKFARSMPNPPLEVGNPQAFHFVFGPEDRDPRCVPLYPAEFGYEHFYTVKPPDGRRQILHVGDSLVAASEVHLGGQFTALLDAMRPGEDHLQFGVGGTDPAAYYVLIKHWIDKLHPDLVVVHVFLGNDIIHFAPEYGCCADEPLETVTPHGFELKCPVPVWKESPGKRWKVGPAIYSFRVLAHYSVAAARIVEAMERGMRHHRYVGEAAVPDGWNSRPERLDRFRDELYAIRDELARRHIPLIVSVIPPRWTLVQNDPADEMRGVRIDVLRILSEGGIRAADSWDMFQAAMRTDRAEEVFYSKSIMNPHMDYYGHELYAKWLVENVLTALPPQ